MRYLVISSLIVLCAAGCRDRRGGSTFLDSGAPHADAGTTMNPDASVQPPVIRTEAEVCAAWGIAVQDQFEGTWTGDVGSCDPGDMSADWRDRALAQINFFRWLAELPPVTHSPARNAAAQECALMMNANRALSHTPPTSWTCFTSNGSDGAGSSNIAGQPAVGSIRAYMVDPGNETTLGHRRWTLSNSLGPTGIGSTDEFSCMWTIGGDGDAGRAWTAWPPPGVFPIEAGDGRFTTIDETGWSIQSDGIPLDAANVRITSDGSEMPVEIVPLQPGFGSRHAIAILPQSWQLEIGRTYHVSVTGTSPGIEYDVQIVSCASADR